MDEERCCKDDFGGSHYHCGNCGKVSGMIGHTLNGEFTCEPEDRLLTIADFIPSDACSEIEPTALAYTPDDQLDKPIVVSDEGLCQLLCGDDEYHKEDCPIGIKLRDCWCTPKWLTDLLPEVSLDPCSNPFSTVKARRRIQLEELTKEQLADEKKRVIQGDGLAKSWSSYSVFVNPPYSGIMPWARKADEAKAFIFLVNNVTTTKWYRELLHNGGSYKFEFDKRLKFTPPPRIKQSSNSRDQVLVCNREGWQMIGNRLDGYGKWWVEHVGYVAE